MFTHRHAQICFVEGIALVVAMTFHFLSHVFAVTFDFALAVFVCLRDVAAVPLVAVSHLRP